MYSEASDSSCNAVETGHNSRLEGRVVGVVTCISTMFSYVKRVIKPYHFIDVGISSLKLCTLQRAGACNKHVIICRDKNI
jgi:hypothetical protein